MDRCWCLLKWLIAFILFCCHLISRSRRAVVSLQLIYIYIWCALYPLRLWLSCGTIELWNVWCSHIGTRAISFQSLQPYNSSRVNGLYISLCVIVRSPSRPIFLNVQIGGNVPITAMCSYLCRSATYIDLAGISYRTHELISYLSSWVPGNIITTRHAALSVILLCLITIHSPLKPLDGNV